MIGVERRGGTGAEGEEGIGAVGGREGRGGERRPEELAEKKDLPRRGRQALACVPKRAINT